MKGKENTGEKGKKGNKGTKLTHLVPIVREKYDLISPIFKTLGGKNITMKKRGGEKRFPEKYIPLG